MWMQLSCGATEMRGPGSCPKARLIWFATRPVWSWSRSPALLGRGWMDPRTMGEPTVPQRTTNDTFLRRPDSLAYLFGPEPMSWEANAQERRRPQGADASPTWRNSVD